MTHLPEPGDERPGRGRDLPGGQPDVPPLDTTILGATLLVMWGPFAWAAMGAGSYMAQSSLCALEGPDPSPLLWGLAALTMALTALGLALARPLAGRLLGPHVEPATAGFLMALSRAMGALSLLGIAWLALVVLVLPACPQLR